MSPAYSTPPGQHNAKAEPLVFQCCDIPLHLDGTVQKQSPLVFIVLQSETWNIALHERRAEQRDRSNEHNVVLLRELHNQALAKTQCGT